MSDASRRHEIRIRRFDPASRSRHAHDSAPRTHRLQSFARCGGAIGPCEHAAEALGEVRRACRVDVDGCACSPQPSRGVPRRCMSGCWRGCRRSPSSPVLRLSTGATVRTRNTNASACDSWMPARSSGCAMPSAPTRILRGQTRATWRGLRIGPSSVRFVRTTQGQRTTGAIRYACASGY